MEAGVIWFQEQVERLLLGLYGKNLGFIATTLDVLAPGSAPRVLQCLQPRMPATFRSILNHSHPEYCAKRFYATPPSASLRGTVFDKELDPDPKMFGMDGATLRAFRKHMPFSELVDTCEDAGCQNAGDVADHMLRVGRLSEKKSWATRMRAENTVVLLVVLALAMRRHVTIYKALGHLYTGPSPEASVDNTVAFADSRIRLWLFGADSNGTIALFEAWKNREERHD